MRFNDGREVMAQRISFNGLSQQLFPLPRSSKPSQVDCFGSRRLGISCPVAHDQPVDKNTNPISSFLKTKKWTKNEETCGKTKKWTKVTFIFRTRCSCYLWWTIRWPPSNPGLNEPAHNSWGTYDPTGILWDGKTEAFMAHMIITI